MDILTHEAYVARCITATANLPSPPHCDRSVQTRQQGAGVSRGRCGKQKQASGRKISKCAYRTVGSCLSEMKRSVDDGCFVIANGGGGSDNADRFRRMCQ